MTRRRCDRVFQWSCGRYQHAERCGCAARTRHAGACVTEREAGMRAGRRGAAACAESSAARGVRCSGETAAIDGARLAAHERDDGTRRGTRTSTRRARARHTRDSHVSPTQKESACQRPCPTIL
ncbi:hypothetical protein A8E25_05315 [Burkholderia cenocepacia]|nr:hypothetical protein BURCENK562V_C0439 [Burkholderia cenocepacia K56-2Valvano]ONR59931.1 hypothetical protein A8E17_14265 [Burkholderia cenocepacia]ONR69118.1 hypothetical protein A8E18_21200 [Burkholderia cenocepacia]ONR69344.1 hypothetical protein A8E22_36345 [Burkholderia cenocepacia]ONR79141.1 hypothetical protein A8E23_00760 [Burkholderia cenocepacia]